MSDIMSTQDSCWSKNQTLHLIREFRKYPCLYNTLDISFTNKKRRNEKLVMIFDEMKKHKKDVTVQSIKNKIRTLQSQISREKSKLKNSTIDDVCKYTPRLWCFNDLSFLFNNEDGETSVPIPSSSNIDLSNLSEADGTGGEELIDTQETSDNNSNTYQQLQIKALDAYDYAKPLVKHPPIEVSHENKEVFCRYLLCELKQIKLEGTFDDLKLEILQLVTKRIKEERQMLREKNYFQPISKTYDQEIIYTDRNHRVPLSDPLKLHSVPELECNPLTMKRATINVKEEQRENHFVIMSYPRTSTFTTSSTNSPYSSSVAEIEGNRPKKRQIEIINGNVHLKRGVPTLSDPLQLAMENIFDGTSNINVERDD